MRAHVVDATVRGHGADSIRQGLAALPLLLLLLLLRCPSAAAAPDGEADRVSPLIQEAEDHYGQGEYARAADAYSTATALLQTRYTREEAQQARVIRDMRLRAAARHNRNSRMNDPVPLVAAMTETLAPLDAIGRQLAVTEHGLARCKAQLGAPADACRWAARALGHDPDREAAILADEDLATARDHPDHEELLLRLGPGRGHLDTGDPLLTLYAQRDFRMRLTLDPGDIRLARLSRLIWELAKWSSRRVGDEAPSRLTIDSYGRLTRLAVISPMKYGGWPYRHSALFFPGQEIKTLLADCLTRFEQRRDEPDGPFWAYLSIFPATHLGKLDVTREQLGYLRERSIWLHDRAIDGLKWLIDAFLAAGAPPAGPSRREWRNLLKEVNRQYDEDTLKVTRIQAWMGLDDAMDYYGGLYLEGRFGLEQNRERAVLWITGAMNAGWKLARHRLARCFRDGLGVAQDLPHALDLLAHGADDRDVPCLCDLAGFHHFGRLGEPDYERARSLYRLAAEEGSGHAMEMLGLLLHRGQGSPRDYEAARKWYEKALEAENAQALRRLGNLMFDSRGGPQDLREAVRALRAALRQVPADRLAFLYGWASLTLLGEDDAARALAKSFLETSKQSGVERALVEGLTDAEFDPQTLLPEAARADATTRPLVLSHINFAIAVRALAADDRAQARRHFEACVEAAPSSDSVRFTAIRELERL